MSNDVLHAIRLLLPSIIAVAHPQRVILFGSAATGTTHQDSDLDFLVIIPDGQNPKRVANRLNMQIRNKPMPCDFIVTTRAAIYKGAATPGGIYQVALTEGKELYVA